MSGMKIGVAIVVATIGGSLVKGLLDLESFGWSMEIQSFVMLAISACVFFWVLWSCTPYDKKKNWSGRL